MKRRWLRWIGLFLLIEGCLYLCGACRPCLSGPEKHAGPPLLCETRQGWLVASEGAKTQWITDDGSPEMKKLVRLVEQKTNRHARRTRAGQLLDERGRVLLNTIDEWASFAYDPGRDLLAWQGSDRRLHLRQNGRETDHATWNIHGIQIMPNGEIWVSEEPITHNAGIARLSSEGRFLAWRVRSMDFMTAENWCEADETILPLVRKLLERKEQ
jgi:hypothetical protein